MVTPRRLGKSELEVSPIGLGCWQFSGGKGLVGRYWEGIGQAAVNEIVAGSLKGGITWFDTAEAYGNGESERRLAAALTAAGKKPGEVVVATKWMPALRTAASIGRTIDARLKCLSPWPVDLHQVHQPFGFSSVELEMHAMAELVAAKKIRAVGVSNYGPERTRRAHAALATKGVALASNQVKYSLLDRHIERNGTLAAAKALGVTIIAYSPLEQGILTGRFHADPGSIKGRPGYRKFLWAFKQRSLERSRPLVDELGKIAAAHGATHAQVALAWLLQFHGDTVMAIPGASRLKQLEDNVAAMSLTLTQLELDTLDRLSRPFL